MRSVATVPLVLVLLVQPAAAQPSALAGLEGAVRSGEKVLVVTSDGSQVTGRVRTLTAASLALETRNGLETLPATRIARIVVKDSIRNGFWIGLGIGAATGLAGGLLVNAICVNETGPCPGAVLALTGIGAAGGAGLGAGLDGLRHRTVLNAMPQLPAEYAPQFVLNLGLGRSAAAGGRTAGPASLGGAWGMRHSSGFGLELDTNRTFGRSIRTVPCAEAPSASPSVDGCVGEGREGVEDTTTGSAKVQYFFSGSRVQPYVSGGVAVYQASSWSSVVVPRFLTGEPFLLESLNRRTGLAAVGGGGVRIALTRRVSLQPDVTLYTGDGWTHLRAGVGLGVGW